MPVGCLYAYFGRMSIQVLCSLLNWIICSSALSCVGSLHILFINTNFYYSSREKIDVPEAVLCRRLLCAATQGKGQCVSLPGRHLGFVFLLCFRLSCPRSAPLPTNVAYCRDSLGSPDPSASLSPAGTLLLAFPPPHPPSPRSDTCCCRKGTWNVFNSKVSSLPSGNVSLVMFPEPCLPWPTPLSTYLFSSFSSSAQPQGLLIGPSCELEMTSYLTPYFTGNGVCEIFCSLM